MLLALLLLCSVVSSVDHYRILGLGRRAGDREIKKAYEITACPQRLFTAISQSFRTALMEALKVYFVAGADITNWR